MGEIYARLSEVFSTVENIQWHGGYHQLKKVLVCFRQSLNFSLAYMVQESISIPSWNRRLSILHTVVWIEARSSPPLAKCEKAGWNRTYIKKMLISPIRVCCFLCSYDPVNAHWDLILLILACFFRYHSMIHNTGFYIIAGSRDELRFNTDLQT